MGRRCLVLARLGHRLPLGGYHLGSVVNCDVYCVFRASAFSCESLMTFIMFRDRWTPLTITLRKLEVMYSQC